MNKQKLHTGTTRHPVPARAELHGCDQGKEKKWTERTLSVPPDPLLLNSATLPLAEWNKGLEQERNSLKAVCRTPALQSTSSACVLEAMRAGWDGVTVRAVYMTLFLRVYALMVTLCKYLVIKVYLGLFDIFLTNSEVFILIIHTKIKVTALNKTKPLKNNLF